MIFPTPADMFALAVYDAPNDMRELTIDRVLAIAIPETDDGELDQSYYLEHDGWCGVDRVRCTGPLAYVLQRARELLAMPGLRYIHDGDELFGGPTHPVAPAA